MPTYIAFLRAVNIGKRQYKTADLRAALTSAGYADVDTYIQTGNVRITSATRSRAKVETELEALFLGDRGFEVPTMVFSPSELKALVADAAGVPDLPPTYAHYISRNRAPPKSLKQQLRSACRARRSLSADEQFTCSTTSPTARQSCRTQSWSALSAPRRTGA
jgi:uncharacterized protein (DUF1697 family)